MTWLARLSARLKNQSTQTTPLSCCGATTAFSLAKKSAEVKADMRKLIPAHHEPPGPTYDLPGRKRNPVRSIDETKTR